MAHPQKSIEVYDNTSALILYDKKTNEILPITDKDTIRHMQTFPSWGPDGRYLYFSRAEQSGQNRTLDNIKHIHYNLARKSFDPESREFGETEIVFNASEMEKSASFPRVSPNGKYLVFTLHDYGTFPIWHKEADLYLLNLQNREYRRMDLNSSETESYHTWSSNGKWLVFSSKRRDGRSARPYFAYFGDPDHVGKPFVLPQEDPTLYQRMLKTFNIPEFVSGRIEINTRDFVKAASRKSINAQAGSARDIPADWIDSTASESSEDKKWGGHR